MAGRNCAFPQCTNSDYKPKRLVKEHYQLFAIPARKDPFYTQWRNELTNVLGRYRQLDTHLKDRILAGKVCICEQHFAKEDIELTSKYYSNIVRQGGHQRKESTFHLPKNILTVLHIYLRKNFISLTLLGSFEISPGVSFFLSRVFQGFQGSVANPVRVSHSFTTFSEKT